MKGSPGCDREAPPIGSSPSGSFGVFLPAVSRIGGHPLRQGWIEGGDLHLWIAGRGSARPVQSHPQVAKVPPDPSADLTQHPKPHRSTLAGDLDIVQRLYGLAVEPAHSPPICNDQVRLPSRSTAAPPDDVVDPVTIRHTFPRTRELVPVVPYAQARVPLNSDAYCRVLPTNSATELIALTVNLAVLQPWI